MNSLDEILKNIEQEIDPISSEGEDGTVDAINLNDKHDFNGDDFYVPESADFVLDSLMKPTKSNWNDGTLQVDEVLSKFGELKNKASKYKKISWKLKQKQVSLESKNTILENQLKMYEEQINTMKQEKQDALDSNKQLEDSVHTMEQSITSLKLMISDKNREIANLEKDLAVANRKLIPSPNSQSDDEKFNEMKIKLTKRISELEEVISSQNSSLEQIARGSATNVDEESRLLSLENFVNLVRTLAMVQQREDAIQLLKMTDSTCFHCGRNLSESHCDKDETGCNYCSILTHLFCNNHFNNQPVSDDSMLFLIVFVLLSIALAIVVYNWRNDTVSLALGIKDKVSSFIFRVCFIFSVIYYWNMNSFSDSKYIAVVGLEHYISVTKTTLSRIEIPLESIKLPEDYVQEVTSPDGAFLKTIDDMTLHQKINYECLFKKTSIQLSLTRLKIPMFT